MAHGVYFRDGVLRKKKSGILDFGKMPPLGFIFYHNIERKTKVILNGHLVVIKMVVHEPNAYCFNVFGVQCYIL